CYKLGVCPARGAGRTSAAHSPSESVCVYGVKWLYWRLRLTMSALAAERRN
ncbi:unnamed protein product, partial [Nesidiocoris tenuis]